LTEIGYGSFAYITATKKEAADPTTLRNHEMSIEADYQIQKIQVLPEDRGLMLVLRKQLACNLGLREWDYLMVHQGHRKIDIEKAYAASVSDPDRIDLGLSLLSVTGTIRRDPGWKE
jgi:hypothetical protein